MLEAQGTIYNHLSPDLRAILDQKAVDAGRYVRYKFDIAKKNPDGHLSTGGEFLYPHAYIVTPVTYKILDPGDRKEKRIALVHQLKEQGAEFDQFNRIVIKEGWQGIYTLDLQKAYDRDVFAFLEMHPKMKGGMFNDNEGPALIERIDEKKQADDSLKRRSDRINAMSVAQNMRLPEIKDFAAAMGWNETDEAVILRDKITQIAEEDPEFFRSFIDNKSIEYRAAVKRAIDNNIIAFHPVESKFIWCSNKQTIAVLDRVEGHNVIERMTDWIMVSKNGQEVYTKLKAMLAQRNQPA